MPFRCSSIVSSEIDSRFCSIQLTDEVTRYWRIGKEFAARSSVNHATKEYARSDVTTNT